VAAAGALLVAAVALGPPAAYVAQSLPFTTEPVAVPTWFRTVAPGLGGHQVLLVLPAPFSGRVSAIAWPATGDFNYSLIGVGGPGAYPTHGDQAERAGKNVLAGLSFSSWNIVPPLTAADVVSVRQALRGWGATMVVIPDEPGLPIYDQVISVTTAATLVTAATGERPLHQANAWVWTAVDRRAPSGVPSTAALGSCTSGVPPSGAAAVESATACALAAS
jgi:hypothetical protein